MKESARVEIRQRAQELRSRLVGASVGEMTRGTVEVDQELGTVTESGEDVGFEAGRMTGGNAKVEQEADKVEKEGSITGVKLDKL